MALAYSDESLAAAAAAVDRLDAVLAALRAYRQEGPDDTTLSDLLASTRAGFESALDDDLNVSQALGALFDGVRDLTRRIHARSLSTAAAAPPAALLAEPDTVPGGTPPAP